MTMVYQLGLRHNHTLITALSRQQLITSIKCTLGRKELSQCESTCPHPQSVWLLPQNYLGILPLHQSQPVLLLHTQSYSKEPTEGPKRPSRMCTVHASWVASAANEKDTKVNLCSFCIIMVISPFLLHT